MSGGIDLHQARGENPIPKFWVLFVHGKQRVAQNGPLRIGNLGANRDEMGRHGALLGEAAKLLTPLKGEVLVLVQNILADRCGLGITVQHTLYRRDIPGTKPDISFAKEFLRFTRIRN